MQLLNSLPPVLGENLKGEKIYVNDSMLLQLIEGQPLALEKAEVKRKQFSQEELCKLRVRAKKDLYFLASGVLGYDRLAPRLHGNMCQHIERKRRLGRRFQGTLMPRGNFKTTIKTITDSIQCALPITKEDLEYDGWWFREGQMPSDYDLGSIAYPSSLGIDLRLLIGHETHESSARFLYAITNHFTNNPTLMALFPEAVPSPRKQRMNKWELELPRNIQGNPEPTFDTLGVGGKSQGRHYNYIKLDDIFGDKARDSESEAETTREWFDNIQPFFDRFSLDHLDLTGTRYSFDDVYSHAMERYGDEMDWYIRKLEEKDLEGKVVISFPEEFTEQSIRILKKNKRVWDAQYQNDPSDSTAGFMSEWRKYFTWIDRDRLRYEPIKNLIEIINVRDLDVCILVDPGEERSGGYVVTGMDHKRRIFILSAIRLELKPNELTDVQFKQVIRWQPRTTAIESDFFMKLFENYWMAEMRLRNIRFHITPVKTGGRRKIDRIAGLTNYFANGQIIMNVAQEELEEEYRVWGKSKNIHILDALAYGPEVWRPGYAPGTRMTVHNTSAVPDIDPETGYSRITA